MWLLPRRSSVVLLLQICKGLGQTLASGFGQQGAVTAVQALGQLQSSLGESEPAAPPAPGAGASAAPEEGGGEGAPSETWRTLPAPAARLPQETLHRAFHYADIAAHLLQKPTDLNLAECQEACLANGSCAAWELCAPLGDGCEGCYLVGRAPRTLTERTGWHAAIVDGREELGWSLSGEQAGKLKNLTVEECRQFLLDANGADQSQPFHEPAVMQRYTACGFVLRDAEGPRQIFVPGQHWPTFLVTSFWDPPVALPPEMEEEMRSSAGRQRLDAGGDAAAAGEGGPGITSQLHAAVGTRSWEEHVREKPRGPHAFVLPFYDTNIGHWMKQHGSMNPLQSYEMQSLLHEGQVALDVGANLGCYTLPFAERVGPRGKVLAFEPFRWLQQIVSGNVAINGLSNVWVFPAGLGSQTARIEARPPQLRFFSSPGGMRARQPQEQQSGMKPEEAMQLYDWDSPPELITILSLDELLFSSHSPSGSDPPSPASLLNAPALEDIRLIKIDVEGMEKEVVAGAREAIWRFKPIIWTENVAYFSSNGQDTSFLQLMNELQYSCAQAQNAPNDIVCTDHFGRGHQIGT